MKICKDPKGSRKAVFGGDLTGSFETEHKNLGPARYADQEEFTEEFGMMSGPVLDVIWDAKVNKSGLQSSRNLPTRGR